MPRIKKIFTEIARLARNEEAFFLATQGFGGEKVPLKYNEFLQGVGDTATKVMSGEINGGKLLVPQGVAKEQFKAASRLIKNEVSCTYENIVVHGSRANGTARIDSDIDFAIRVSPSEFERLIAQNFRSVNPGSSKEKTMLHAIKTGKIQAGEAGLRLLRKQLAKELDIKVDVSIIEIGGSFDQGPFIEVQ